VRFEKSTLERKGIGGKKVKSNWLAPITGEELSIQQFQKRGTHKKVAIGNGDSQANLRKKEEKDFGILHEGREGSAKKGKRKRSREGKGSSHETANFPCFSRKPNEVGEGDSY